LEPSQPLVRVVADRALAAAFEDPRTNGLRAADWPELELEVSVLSSLEPFAVGSYDELVEYVRGEPLGLLVEAGRHRATFLPSVWEELPPEEFVAALWRKAGLARRAWPEGIELSRYSATKACGLPPRAPLRD